jgi:S-adenosylmethionine:tRNA ribosyltransferase-isomerase
LALAFDLPREREARRPPEARGVARDGVALLVSDAGTATHTSAHFTGLAKYLRAGDLLVVNDSRTIAAAVDGRRSNGAQVTLHFSTRISESMWIVEPRDAGFIEVGERIVLPQGGSVELLAPLHRAHPRLWYARVLLPLPAYAYLARNARPVTYGYLEGRYGIDTYQTIFAREPGSVEMPSAARPFTLRVLDSLYRHNVNIASVTLHCGVSSPETHEPPLDERFAVPEWSARAINATRARGGRVIAVGTTVVRAIESATDKNGVVHAAGGWTAHVVDAQHPPRAIDGLLTGFHEPRASHLLMLEAFASHAVLATAYETALSRGFLWHEFGDVHLILRASNS